jgi:MoaA/NifB/PqqE/SkfB family radical SAM enzyme
MDKRLLFNWIEVHISTHCNVRCNSCSHHSPFMTPRFYDLNQFQKDIGALSKVCRVNLLWFIGGEPLLNPRISEFIEASKKINFAKLQAISTNGILIPKMEERFFSAVDYIFVALYPALFKLRPALRNQLSNKSKIHGFKFSLTNRSFFYNVETTEKLSNDVALASYSNCDRIKRGPFVENGYFYKCMRPVTTGEYLRKRSYTDDIPDFKTLDGVQIHAPLLKERITAYMKSKKCLQSCYFCQMGLKDDSKVTLWRRTKAVFDDVKFLRNIIYRNKGILSACHSIQGLFEKDFLKKARTSAINIGVPLVPHRMLTREECRDRSQLLQKGVESCTSQ